MIEKDKSYNIDHIKILKAYFLKYNNKALLSKKLKQLIVLPSSLVSSVLETGLTRRLLNFYGPTEATICSSSFDCQVGTEPLIGSACWSTSLYVDSPIGCSSTLFIGGDGVARGYWCRPSFFTNVSSSHRIAREEIFGPVLSIIGYASEDDAVRIANDTPFGLAAYFYTNDLTRSFRVSEALEVGMIGLNVGGFATEVAPFGGIKESGQGREGSKYGPDDYLEIKYLCLGGIDQ